jgi:transglutaminase-like putative cysteine protease
MEPTQRQWVFALDIPYQWTLERTYMTSQQQIASEKPIDQRIAYHAVSYLRYQLGSGTFGDPRAWYTALPAGSNPRTTELARRMRLAAASDRAFIENVLAMFHEQEYFYTLEPPPLGSHPVDRFLFDTRRGFCEHYASAFAVIMRAAGLPSRIVLGYQGGEINPVGQYMIVRQSDAHAWTEVWLPDSGWLRVDPTASVAPERIESGMSAARFAEAGASWGLTAPSELLHQLKLGWDALNAQWNEWILGYGPENQTRFMQWLGMQEPNWHKMITALLVSVISLLVLISFLLLSRYRPPPKDAAALLYRRFTRKTGIAPELGESPQAYVRRLAGANVAQLPEMDGVTRCYLAARYGPPNPRTVAALRVAVNEFTARRK